jgi:hypothetical protein
MNRTNKMLVGIFLLAAVVSASLYSKAATHYDEYRAQVNNVMKDPDSSQFKNEQVFPSGVYCAEVNSKNSYGAFVGFQRVVVGRFGEENYTLFERDGVKNDSIGGTLVQLKLQTATTWAKVNTMRRERADGDKSTLSEQEYQEIALRKVFEEEWSENCSQKVGAK